MITMNKTLENVQQLGKEWGTYSKRVSRDALRAMSGQLENAARYLGSLSHRIEDSSGDSSGEGRHGPADIVDAANEADRGAEQKAAQPSEPVN